MKIDNQQIDIDNKRKEIILEINSAIEESFGVLSFSKIKNKKGKIEDFVTVTFNNKGSYDVDVHLVLAKDVKITEVLRSTQKNIKFHLSAVKEKKVNKINVFAESILD